MSNAAHYVPTGGVPRRVSIDQELDPGAAALGNQVGGSHYKHLKIQPMEYSMANKLDACQHTVVKYITRFRDKGGIEDLKKARHAIDLLMQFEYPNG